MLTRVRLAASSSAAGPLLRRGALRILRPLSTYPPHTLLPMPALSPTMTQGNLAAWKKAEGEEIAAGDVIAEVETDKATVDYEVVDDGIIAKILVPEGAQDIAVGTPLAVVVDDAADVGESTETSITSFCFINLDVQKESLCAIFFIKGRSYLYLCFRAPRMNPSVVPLV